MIGAEGGAAASAAEGRSHVAYSADGRPMAARALWTLLRFEIAASLKAPVFWIAVLILIFFLLGIRGLFAGRFVLNGREVDEQLRLVYFLGVGYSALVFLTTMYALAVCADRTGASYLKGNDLLILSRAVGRTTFYAAKCGGAFAACALFALLSLMLFWISIYWFSGINLYSLLLLPLPQGLSLSALVAVYFLARQFAGNFFVFFLWLAYLPFSYATNLWFYFAEPLRAGAGSWNWIQFLPQFGGLHAFSLGMVQDFYRREAAWSAVANLGLWTAAALVLGIWWFRRKRL